MEASRASNCTPKTRSGPSPTPGLTTSRGLSGFAERDFESARQAASPTGTEMVIGLIYESVDRRSPWMGEATAGRVVLLVTGECANLATALELHTIADPVERVQHTYSETTMLRCGTVA
jgi:hypothetical protein